MLHECDFSKIYNFTQFTKYGLAGFQSKTYTHQHFPQGHHYNPISEYNQHCTGPFTRQLIWNLEAN